MGKKKPGRNKPKQFGVGEIDHSSPSGPVKSPAAQVGKKKKLNKGRRQNNGKQYDNKLQQLIEADGTKSVIEMAADGNCLFRSLSDQLYHDYGNKHDEVRAEICDFLEEHKDEFSLFLVLDDEDARDDEDAANFEEYVENMRQSGEWGGNVELVVAARLYRRNITVYAALLAAFTIDHGQPNKESAGPDLLLSYHDNDHYNSVRDNTGKGKPPPPIKTFVKQGASISRQKAKQAETEACLSELPSFGDSKDDADVNKDDRYKVYDSEVVPSKQSADHEICVKEESGAYNSHAVENDKQSNKQRKKSAPCPCGSGLRYKKCCLAREKHNVRLQRIHADDKHGTVAPSNNTRSTEAVMDGEFRVLKI